MVAGTGDARDRWWSASRLGKTYATGAAVAPSLRRPAGHLHGADRRPP